MATSLAILADATAKATLILLLATLLAIAMRRQAAAARHLLWTAAVVGVLALPALSWTLPALSVLPESATMPAWQSAHDNVTSQPSPPVRGTEPAPGDANAPPADVKATARVQPPSTDAATPDPTPSTSDSPATTSTTTEPATAATDRGHATISEPPSDATAAQQAAEPAASDWQAWLAWLPWIWLGGASFALLPVLLGSIGLWRLKRRSTRVSDAAWVQLLRQLQHELGVRGNVELRRANRPVMPMTWGIFGGVVPLTKACILIPSDADAWSPDRRRAVLLHELSHVKRFDCLTQMLAQFACALYWFNPLIWLAAHRMLIERERACDDRVLLHETKPSAYAEHLLEIAAGPQPGLFTPHAGAIAMARRNSLETRLREILDHHRTCRSMSRLGAALTITLLGAITIPLAMLQAEEGPDASEQEQDQAQQVPEHVEPIIEALEELVEIHQRRFEQVQLLRDQGRAGAPQERDARENLLHVRLRLNEVAGDQESVLAVLRQLIAIEQQRVERAEQLVERGHGAAALWNAREALLEARIRYFEAGGDPADLEALPEAEALNDGPSVADDSAEHAGVERRNVRISGNVRRPGVYAIPEEGLTLAELIAAAGGLADDFDPDLGEARILREEEGRTSLHGGPLSGTQADAETALRAGDQVFVISTADEQEADRREGDADAFQLPRDVQISVTLDEDRSVALIGGKRVAPEPGRYAGWWRPDGSRLAGQPYEERFGPGGFRTGGYRDAEVLEFAVTLSSPHIELTVREPEGAETTPVQHVDDSDQRLLRAFRVALHDPQRRTLDLELGVAAGPWEDIARWEFPWERPAELREDLVPTASISQPREAGPGVEIRVSHDALEQASRVVVIDREGNVHPGHLLRTGAGRSGTGRGGGTGLLRPPGTIYPPPRNAEEPDDEPGVLLTVSNYLFHDLDPADVDAIVLQAQSYEWVTFRNISLEPGHETEVEVEVERADRQLDGHDRTALQVGDELKVHVFELIQNDRMYVGNHVIDSDGTIELPVLGRVEAEGVTAGELQQRLRKRLDESDVLRDAIVSVLGRQELEGTDRVNALREQRAALRRRLRPEHREVQRIDQEIAQAEAAAAVVPENEAAAGEGAHGPAELLAARELAYDPVRHRVIEAWGESEGDRLAHLNLDTGGQPVPEPEVREDGSRDFTAWSEQAGIDLVRNQRQREYPLLTFRLSAFPAEPEAWDQPANQLVDHFASLLEEQPATVGWLAVPAELPATYRFRTRAGSIGVLQITGFTDTGGVEIRYKLVEGFNEVPRPEDDVTLDLREDGGASAARTV